MLPSPAGLQVEQARSNGSTFCTLQSHCHYAEGVNGSASKKNHMLAMSSDQMGKSMKLKELLMAPTGPRHLERCGDAQQKDEKQQVARG